jgi:hypothetical protein
LTELVILLVAEVGTVFPTVITDKIIQPIWVGVVQGVVSRIGIGVPTLWLLGAGTGVLRVRTHEPTERGAVVPSAKVIEAGFAVPFFAGEFVGQRRMLG